jgi:GTP-binding protein Era
LDELSKKADFEHLIPVSAMRGDNLIALENKVLELLPEGLPLFPEDQVTDRTERFLAAELIREKLIRNLEEELPYTTTVEIERFSEEDKLLRISAVIWVERPGQKAIVIGKQGAMLKKVGSQAREEMERLFGRKVFLELWVRVREGWSDDERALKSLGYDEA